MDRQKGCMYSSVCQFFIKVCILGNNQETNVLVMKVKILSFYCDGDFLFGYMINPISCKCDLLWENVY